MLLDAQQSRALFNFALEKHFAILAVNADSPAAITDCLESARLCGSPIIIETSLWQLKGHSFGAQDAALGMARYLVQISLMANSDRYREVPVIFHTDHIKGPEALPLLQRAIRGLPAKLGAAELQLRPSTVSLDSSELTEAENIEALCLLCVTADSSGLPITLEMEAGVDEGVTPLEVAERLLSAVEKRHSGKIYLWAPGVGSQHGFSDSGYPAFSVDAVRRHQELATRLLGRPIGIALHGSSGLPESHLRDSVRAGAAKVNWSSESLLHRSHAALEFYRQNEAKLEKNHPQFKSTAMDNGVQTFISERYIPKVCERIKVLGGEGQTEAFWHNIATRRTPLEVI